MRFHKYQALGNDYIVIERASLGDADLPAAAVRGLCDRHFGVGSDGMLVEGTAPDGGFALFIFNPDGSEAEKSGNGLRIFARYLWDEGRVGDDAFPVVTKGGIVQCQVRDAGRMVFVEMGKASFDSERIPVTGPRREVVGEEIDIDGEHLRFTAVTVGIRTVSYTSRSSRRSWLGDWVVCSRRTACFPTAPTCSSLRSSVRIASPSRFGSAAPATPWRRAAAAAPPPQPLCAWVCVRVT